MAGRTQAQQVLWADAPRLPQAARPAAQPLSFYRAVDFRLDALRQTLQAAPPADAARRGVSLVVVSLPLPDGTSQRFRVEAAAVMHPQLAARYPAIQTYAAQGLDDPTATARLDITPAGFHAQILAADKTVYIDPVAGSPETHRVFERRAMAARPFGCATPAGAAAADRSRTAARPNGAQLRTFRLALACTGEYATYHGGTKQSALAAMVTSINRVNGIYERELAVRMVLVPNTDELIYLNGTTDPYTNTNGSAMLDQNQTTVDQRIGAGSYDVGHVFSTGGGGIARVASVCEAGDKARGVTGFATPETDAFDVDFVAHEIGHQFGADHTFNSDKEACSGVNRTPESAYEPGSGSTIMAYAGICGTDNLQPNSDPYFHSRSYDQILDHLAGAGSCGISTPTGNRAPAVNAGRNFRIPVGTPFVLTGSATDPDGDGLTFAWEQYNLGPAGSVTAPTGDAPLFRALPPTASASRTFPRLANLLTGAPSVGEVLPTTGRRLVFRLVARDNRAGGGGVAYDSMHVVVVPTAGPFVVQAPNTAAATWQAGAPQQVLWDVAGTAQAAVGAAQVDILLSTDGGLTYPITLAAATPNDGCETLTLPASVAATAQARIRVQATGGIFFDVSNQNFTIQPLSGPAFFLRGPACGAAALQLCPGNTASTTVGTGALQGFTGQLTLSADNLPTGLTATFNSATVAAGAEATVTFTAGANTPSGTYQVAVKGSSGGQTRTVEVPLTVLPAARQAPAVTFPAAGSTATLLRPRITWGAVANASAYEVQIATDAAFTTLVLNQPSVAGTALVPGAGVLRPATGYFLRVRALSTCGPGPYSAPLAFRTGIVNCQTYLAASVPVALPSASPFVVSSTVTVTSSDRVTSLRVRDLALTHANAGELEITLTNPAGRRAVLLPRQCAGSGTLSLTFDETAAGPLPCPPAAGATVRPAASLLDLLNSPAQGTWTLTIADNAAGNGGTLTGWSLELCTMLEPPAPPSDLTVVQTGPDASPVANLTWTDNSPNETGFEIERSATGPDGFVRLATAGPNVTSYEDALRANGTYCYRVRAVGANGVSAYSNEGCLTLTNVPPQASSVLAGLSVWPNPGTGLFELKLDNDREGTVTLRVLDAVGRIISTQTLTKTTVTAQLPLDLRRLGAGLYLLHLTAAGESEVVRVVKE
ncbi:reprolysin-like metallopeptidase [Hymenobacter weizhouensis]|uniref:reprolysin-like metallopeptidase n=1 Tax=Hymenobacter sp. YIM 151500-1 TaxID=2987689 RepID=UPI0022280035|nr:zinc-dependent metalloprotease family protein [Hymenobacter sp. YIM 151500-1]UYZ61410.1 M12 family metallo-peptidase [Hymenobacter sp. YIM 151500-1]